MISITCGNESTIHRRLNALIIKLTSVDMDTTWTGKPVNFRSVSLKRNRFGVCTKTSPITTVLQKPFKPKHAPSSLSHHSQSSLANTGFERKLWSRKHRSDTVLGAVILTSLEGIFYSKGFLSCFDENVLVSSSQRDRRQFRRPFY